MREVGRIAVLGGGPAGGAAALALARGRAAVTPHPPERPGEKPRGRPVPPHARPRLAGFDPSALPAVASPPLRLEDGAGSGVDSALDGVRIFRRRDLDGALVAAAAAAGARIEPRRVESLEPFGGPREGGGVRVAAGGESRPYDWVVGADGARGLSRRTAGLRPEGESVGLGATLRGQAALPLPDPRLQALDGAGGA